jgi:hypothetical protein
VAGEVVGEQQYIVEVLSAGPDGGRMMQLMERRF